MQKGIDILLSNPTDSVGIQSAVSSANKAGVVVVAVDAQANGPIDSFVGSKNYDAGLLAGEALAKSLDGRGNVAILDGIPVAPILERVRGFKDAIAKHPGLKLVMMEIPRGIALLYTGGYPQSGLPSHLPCLGVEKSSGYKCPF